MSKRLVVAVSGASGPVYARRFLQALLEAGGEAHLVLSKAAIGVIHEEMGIAVGGPEQWAERFLGRKSDRVIPYPAEGMHCRLASGTFRTDGMVVIPCSVGRAGSIAAGLSRDLIDRAAEVTMKEGRRLAIVPRETPLSAIALDNLAQLARVGVLVMPAMPAFYMHPKTLEDAVDFVAGKALDLFGVEHALFRRYGG